MLTVTPPEEIEAVLRLARANITTDPIIIGYDAEGVMTIIASPEMGVERMYFMLSQALALLMEGTTDEVEDDA